jgi:sugar/nucleoside kinase (ribokinase family)
MLIKMAHGMLDLGVKKAVIIHCVERVVWVDANRDAFIIEIEPLRPDEIASNLGAGDAFCAGLLYGIHQNRKPEGAIQLGNAAAQASLKGLTATSAISAAAIDSLR